MSFGSKFQPLGQGDVDVGAGGALDVAPHRDAGAAAGLAVAIPAVIFYNYFSNKVAEFDYNVESFSTDFINLIERDILART